jgi:hypothetical protein
MPKYKNHIDFFSVVSTTRTEFESYGAFPRDKQGEAEAEAYKRELEKDFPRLEFKIIEK